MFGAPTVARNREFLDREGLAIQDLDAALVRALQRNGRASIQELARAVGAPRGTVSAHVRRLLAERRLRIVAAADPTLLGEHVVAHVSIVASGAAAPVVEDLVARQEAVFVSAVSGTHAVVAELRVGTTHELHEVLGDLRCNEHVVALDTLLHSEVVKGFFVAHRSGEATVDVDEIDLHLVELLQQDPRASYRDLGAAVRLSPSAVAARARRLIDNRIVTISAIETRNADGRQLAMGVGLNLAGSGDEVLEAVRAAPSIDFAAVTVGRFDLVATIVAPTSGALVAALDEIRSMRGVRRTSTWLHLDVVKEDYIRRR